MEYGPGSIIAERYHIRCTLGKGGMGTVYKAKDVLLDINVALKILHVETDDNAIIRFQREAKSSGKLGHENIATTIDFAQTKDGISYLVMEYVEGSSLEDLLLKNDQIDLKLSLELFKQLSSAMVHAHSKGILHRDLKPSNVIVSETGGGYSASIVDFGLAKPVEDAGITQAGIGIGSPLYMSPEQIRGKPVDEKSDLYSFGCLMFKTLTGRPPHIGESAMETLNLHLSKKAPSIHEVSNIAFPDDLIDLVDSCLERNQENRIDSFLDVENRLNSIAEGLLEEVDRENERGIAENFDYESKNRKSALSKMLLFQLGVVGILVVICSVVFLNWKNDEGKNVLTGENPGSKIQRHQKKMTVPVDSSFMPLLGDMLTKEIRIEKDKPTKVRAISISDKDMDKVRDVILSNSRIKSLSIATSYLTSRGLEKISSIQRLKKISFKRTKIDSSAFKTLSKMKQLQYLNFDDSNTVRVENLREICTLPNLQTLSLVDTGIGDKHMEEIAKFPNLFRLDIGHGVYITPAGLKLLLPMKNLKRINIDANYTTPEFLSLYPKFKNLELLEFEYVDPLPRHLLLSLRKNMPDCKIYQSVIERSRESKRVLEKHLK